jgi:c-di-GMP-binding flagellar brake protein YcgR
MDKDNRRSARVDCMGHAEIQKLPAVGKPCAARIENMSEGGCLMELQEAKDFSIDEVVELSFCINHLAFRVRAQVRAIRPKAMIGFEFLKLSQRARGQIKDVLDELAKSAARHPVVPVGVPAHGLVHGYAPHHPNL